MNSLRLALARAVKALLSPFRFRGKGTILLALCPRRGEVAISLFGYRFVCDLSEHIQRSIFLFGYDPDAERFLRAHLKLGDTFVDVGANVGFYTLLASSIVGNAGRVFAIEPNPRPYAKLLETIAKNQIRNVVALNIALGRNRTELDLYLNRTGDNDSATMVAHDGKESVNVQVFALDEIAATHHVAAMDYLKIDVDGFEPEVFAGAGRILSENRIRALQAEFSDYWLRRNGSSPEQLHRLLTDAGFEDVEGEPRFVTDCIVDRFFVNRRPALER